MTWRLSDHVHELRAGVFLVVGPASNWLIVRDGTATLLIDGGYPADAGRVMDSLQLAGAPGRPDAVLLTHAHLDHMGAALVLARQGVPVWCSHDETGNADGTAPEQIDAETGLSLAESDPLWARWAHHAMSAGGLSADRLRRSELHAFSPDNDLDLPGRPRALSSASHTSGHVSIECGEVLAAGDALITSHPTTTKRGPQLLHPAFHQEPSRVADVAGSLIERTQALVVAPGHGEATSTDAVRAALPLSDGSGDLD